jgi:glycosidase
MAQQLKAWWKESSVYQVYPASFQDSTGSGTGDLKGITSRVDYLHNLGVDIVWLSPIFESPQIDMVRVHRVAVIPVTDFK